MTNSIILPEEFRVYTRTLMGDERFSALIQGLSQEPTTSIRLNPLKCDTQRAQVADAAGRVAWCDAGVYLNRRPAFTSDPLLHSGLYYVQEASSMFVHHVLRQLVTEPVTMLDLCAAPGGKSTVCRAALPAQSLLVSNEPLRQRANILAENMQKQGHPDVIVTNNYARDFQRAGLTFDVILADVPCSGEGMFRKDSTAVDEWSTQNVEKCQRLQREIIADIWPCLRPGGLLIYSTCTFNAKENELNAAWIASELGAEFVSVATQPDWHITPALTGGNPAYRFLPGTSRGEGLFMTILRKTGDAETLPTSAPRKKKKGERGPKPAATTLPLRHAADYCTRERGDKLIAIPLRWADTYDTVAAKLNIMHAGIGIGTRKGRDLLPDQSLALSTELDPEAFPRCDVDAAQAQCYLRKEAMQLPTDAPRGIVLLTHRQLPLGFVKNLGQRANNLYPQEWKIKSSHLTQENTIITKYETIP